MSKLILTLLLAASLPAVHAQIGRSLDWPTYAGDLQRSGWEKSEVRFTKDDIAKTFTLLWNPKLKNSRKENRVLMPPVLIGTLVGYRGFKELAFIAGSDDSLHVVDSDLSRVYWERRFETGPAASPDCGGLTAIPTLMTIGFRRPGPRPPATPGAPPARPAPNPIFAARSIYVITSDGKFHRVNVANGEDAVPPVPVLPANARASTLNMNDSVVYTTTSRGCGSASDAVWAIDLGNPDPHAAPTVASFKSEHGGFVGIGGPVIGTDGTIYAQASNALLALTPKDLKLKGSFVDPAANVTPAVFAHEGKDLIVTAGNDGRLNLLDSTSLETPLSRTEPLGKDAGFYGGLSSWQDADGVRWVLAPVWESSRTGSIVAFKVEAQNGKPALKPAWVSREITRPSPPVIAAGAVFALSNGGAHATLYALDAATGKELWSTGDRVTAPGNLTGLTVANGRVYFSTNDDQLWVFGVPLEW